MCGARAGCGGGLSGEQGLESRSAERPTNKRAFGSQWACYIEGGRFSDELREPWKMGEIRTRFPHRRSLAVTRGIEQTQLPYPVLSPC